MAVATGVSLSGPGAGSVNVPSTPFTVALTPAGGTNAGDTVTPASTIPGTFTPTTVSLSTGTPSATFIFTPTQQGTASITITDTGALTMGAPLPYVAAPAVPALQQLAGNAASPPQNSRISAVPNDYLPIEVTIAECPAPLSAASLAVKVNAAANTALLTKAGLLVDPGTVQADGSYKAIVLFNCLEADTALLPGGATYDFIVSATTTTGRTIPALEAGFWQSVQG